MPRHFTGAEALRHCAQHNIIKLEGMLRSDDGIEQPFCIDLRQTPEPFTLYWAGKIFTPPCQRQPALLITISDMDRIPDDQLAHYQAVPRDNQIMPDATTLPAGPLHVVAVVDTTWLPQQTVVADYHIDLARGDRVIVHLPPLLVEAPR